MRPGPRWGAGVALLWYLAVGVLVPLLDGTLFHADGARDVAHVERTDNPDCHRERCSLQSPVAPQALSAGPAAITRILATGRRADVANVADPLRDARDRRTPQPRAPPRLT